MAGLAASADPEALARAAPLAGSLALAAGDTVAFSGGPSESVKSAREATTALGMTLNMWSRTS